MAVTIHRHGPIAMALAVAVAVAHPERLPSPQPSLARTLYAYLYPPTVFRSTNEVSASGATANKTGRLDLSAKVEKSKGFTTTVYQELGRVEGYNNKLEAV